VPPPRQILLALFLAASGLLAWWIQSDQEIGRNLPQSDKRQPDYTVESLTITTMGESGRPSRRLLAHELRHYPNGGGNELDQPRLTIFRDGEAPWTVRSNAGHINDDGEELLLTGPVFIDREAGENTREMHLKTWDLFIRAPDEYARTDRRMHLTSGADWMSSVSGGELWFGEQLRLNLFGRARLQFDFP